MDKKSLTTLKLQAVIAVIDMIDRAVRTGKPMDTVDISFSTTSAVSSTEVDGKLRVVSYNAELLCKDDGAWFVESEEESDEIG